jgi:hypothetical protein
MSVCLFYFLLPNLKSSMLVSLIITAHLDIFPLPTPPPPPHTHTHISPPNFLVHITLEHYKFAENDKPVLIIKKSISDFFFQNKRWSQSWSMGNLQFLDP